MKRQPTYLYSITKKLSHKLGPTARVLRIVGLCIAARRDDRRRTVSRVRSLVGCVLFKLLPKNK
jgi:hypothetical protein